MISPPFLKSGDRIGIVATARKVSQDTIETARHILESWGLITVPSPYLYSQKHSYLAGDDYERKNALQQMLDDPTIDAIICARGGYGTTRIIDELDFSAFRKQPKWIIGFSDVTALHLQLASIGIESIHGIMPILFGRENAEESLQSLKEILFGKDWAIKAAPSEFNRPGNAVGQLIGGNLSLIVDALGTPLEPDMTGKILVIEEIEEYLYKIDRMMVQLKRSSKFKSLAGIIVGYFTDIKDSDLSFGEQYQEIIRYHTQNYTFPVGFNFPTGHENPNHAWVQGQKVRLVVGPEDSVVMSGSL